MLSPGKVALAVVTGGIALGTMLGAAANPEMKKPPEQPWQGALQAPVHADAGYRIVEAGPEDLSPHPDSYAPTWADEERADREPDYPAWSYSDFGSDFGDEQAQPPADETPVAVASEAPGPPEVSPEPAEALAPEPPVAPPLDALY